MLLALYLSFVFIAILQSSAAQDFCSSDLIPDLQGAWVCDQNWALGAHRLTNKEKYEEKWALVYKLPDLYAVSKIRTIPKCMNNGSSPLVLSLASYAWDESHEYEFDDNFDKHWIPIEIKNVKLLSEESLEYVEYSGFAHRAPYWKLVLETSKTTEQCLPDFAFFARAGIAALPGYRMYLNMPVFKSSALGSGPPASAPLSHTCNRVIAVPQKVVTHYRLDTTFYRKYTSAYDIPVMSSNVVDDRALQRACYVVRFMLAGRRDLRDHMLNNKGRVAIIGRRETVPMVPEMRRFTTWTRRAAGGTFQIPVNVGAEENMLCERQDRYARDQDIFMHEFAHGIHLIACFTAIPNFNYHLQKAYDNAIRRGLWRNTYARTDNREYFAEGVQAYFNQQREGREGGDGIQNHINTREELRNYDPGLYKIIEDLFPCSNNYIARCDDVNQEASLNQELSYNCNEGPTTIGPSTTKVITSTSTSLPPTTPTTQPTNCNDGHRYCSYWTKIGECRRNPSYMKQNCRRSCRICSTELTTTLRPPTTPANCRNKSRFCVYWAGKGECTRNPRYMRSNCPKSCQFCSLDSCADKDDRCIYWADYCATNKYVAKNCKETCKFC